ncbi:carbohydrate ABC transporter permease [Mycoplasmoides genitalium]
MFKNNLRFTSWINQHKFYQLDLSLKTRLIKQIVLTLVFKTLVLGFFGLIVIFPFYLMVVVSFASDERALDTRTPILWPDSWNFDNFSRVLSDGKYLNAIVVNTLVTVLSVLLTLFFTICMGYSFSLRKWKYKKLVWFFFLSVLILPESALLIGQYRIVIVANWNNPNSPLIVLGLIMPFVSSVFSGFMYRTSFEAIPSQLKESALIDGCNGFNYFLKIALPMVKSTSWTVGILTAFSAWNSYLWPLLLLGNRVDLNINLWVLQQGILDANSSDEQIRTLLNLKMSAAILAILPMFIIYFLFHKRIMNAIKNRANTIKG